MVIKKGILLPIMIGYLLNININAIEKIAFKIQNIKSNQLNKDQQRILDKLKGLKSKVNQSIKNKEIITTEKDIGVFERHFEGIVNEIKKSNISDANFRFNTANNYYCILKGLGRSRDLIMEESYEAFINEANKFLIGIATGASSAIVSTVKDPKEAAKGFVKGASKGAARVALIKAGTVCPPLGVGLLSISGLCFISSYLPIEGSDKPWNQVKSIFYTLNEGEITLGKNIYNREYEQLGEAIGSYIISKGIVKCAAITNSKVFVPSKAKVNDYIVLPKSWQNTLKILSGRNQPDQRVISYKKFKKVINKQNRQKALEKHQGKEFKQRNGKDGAIETYGETSIQNIDESFLYDPAKKQFGKLGVYSEAVAESTVQDTKYSKIKRFADGKPCNKANKAYIEAHSCPKTQNAIKRANEARHFKNKRCYDAKCEEVPLCAEENAIGKKISKSTSNPDGIEVGLGRKTTRDAKVLVSRGEGGYPIYSAIQRGKANSQKLLESVKTALEYDHIVDVDLNFADGMDIRHFTNLLKNNLTSEQLSRVNFVMPKNLVNNLQIGHLTTKKLFEDYFVVANTAQELVNQANSNVQVEQTNSQNNQTQTNANVLENVQTNVLSESNTTDNREYRQKITREIDLELKIDIDQRSKDFEKVNIELNQPEVSIADVFDRADLQKHYSFSSERNNQNIETNDNSRGIYQNFRANYDVSVNVNKLGSLLYFLSVWDNCSINNILENLNDKSFKIQLNASPKQKIAYQLYKINIIQKLLDIAKYPNDKLNVSNIIELNNFKLAGLDQRYFQEIVDYLNSFYFDSKGNIELDKYGDLRKTPDFFKLANKVKDFARKISLTKEEYISYLDYGKERNIFGFANNDIEAVKNKEFKVYSEHYGNHLARTASKCAGHFYNDVKAFVGAKKAEQEPNKILENQNNKYLANILNTLESGNPVEVFDKLEDIRKELYLSNIPKVYKDIAMQTIAKYKLDNFIHGTRIPKKYIFDPLVSSLIQEQSRVINNDRVKRIELFDKLQKRYEKANFIANMLGLNISQTRALSYDIVDNLESQNINIEQFRVQDLDEKQIAQHLKTILNSTLNVLNQDTNGKYRNSTLKQIFNSQGIFKGFNFIEQSFPKIKEIKNLDLVKNKDKVILLNKHLSNLINANNDNIELKALLSIKEIINSLINN